MQSPNTPTTIKKLNRESKLKVLELLEEKTERTRNSKYLSYFPSSGPHAREFYPKHIQFFQAGSTHKERAFIAGNRTGKTTAGAYEMTLHLTGLYPDWWPGVRFNTPITAWAAGVTNEQTRDVIQRELLGQWGSFGTGMIPKSHLIDYTSRAGVSHGIQDIVVKHVSGGISELSLKSYIQGRDTFQGTARHCVWLDEEPPLDIYEECLLRTMIVPGNVPGIMYMTFTPLSGLSDVVMSFLPGGKLPVDGIVPDRIVINAFTSSVPHISEQECTELLKAIPPNQIAARFYGQPHVFGSPPP